MSQLRRTASAVAPFLGIALGIFALLFFFAWLSNCARKSQEADERAHPERFENCEQHCTRMCRPRLVKRTECRGWGPDVCECEP